MADQKNKEQSALEQLKALQEKETISSLQINEPDLKGFDASSVFEIDTPPKEEPKHKIFGKRSQRHAQVKVKASVFDNDDVEVEDIFVAEGLKPQPLKRSQKRHEKPHTVQQEEPVLPQEQPAPVVEEVKVESASVEDEVLKQEEELVEEVQKTSKEEPDVIEETVEEVVSEQPEEEKIVEEEIEDSEIETSLEDENQYDEDDLYVENKRFLLSQYDKEEDYLEEQSKEGFHYVRNVGKKYFFVKEEPRDYYYSICYFVVEPSAHEWRKWEADGWKLVSRVPAKKKKDAGWFVFRNELQGDDLKKEIPNEAEKFKFFKKHANSCRSTMFLFFICMAICACAAYLQYLFNGFIAVIAACAVLFLISFIFFCMYGRMLASSKKKVRLLKARLRVREREETFKNEGLILDDQTEEDLDSQWEDLDDEQDDDIEEVEEEDSFEIEEDEPKKKRRFGKRKNK